MGKYMIFLWASIGLLGLLLVGIGLGLLPFFNSFFIPMVEQNVVLKNNTDVFKAWQSPPTDIFMEFYFFDVLNPEEVVNGSKPIVTQRGPYVYRETRQKIDVNFSAEATEVHYREAKWYTFDRERSVGSENDTVTTLNIAILAIAERIKYQSPFFQGIVNHALAGLDQRLFINKTVRELLWGYTPDVFSKVKHILPHWMWWIFPEVEVGFYIGKTANGSDTGVLSISTGVSDIKNIGKINTWNGNSSLSFWNSRECNMINGTDGSMWHPFISRDEKLHIFVPEMCRSVYIEYDKDSTVSSSNIPVYQYKVPEMLLADATVNPHNGGFCTPPGNCMKSGVLNVSVCNDGAPIVVSLPHFLDADPEYQNAILGLNPNNEDFRIVINVEPVTGVVLSARKMLQVNFYLSAQLKAFQQTMKLSQDFVFPLFYANEHASIGDFEASMFKSMVLRPKEVAKILHYVLVTIGVLLLVSFTLLAFVRPYRQRPKDKEQQVSDSQDSDASLLNEVA